MKNQISQAMLFSKHQIRIITDNRFIKKQLGAPSDTDVEQLKADNEDLKRQKNDLEKKIDALQKEVNLVNVTVLVGN